MLQYCDSSDASLDIKPHTIAFVAVLIHELILGLVWNDPASTLQFVLIKPDASKSLCVVAGDGGEGLEWSQGSSWLSKLWGKQCLEVAVAGLGYPRWLLVGI